jgi:hypothetical protein
VFLKFLRPWSQGSSSGAGGGAAAKQVKWFNKCSWTCQICGTTVTTNSSAFFKHVAEHQVSRQILCKFNFRILRNGQETFSTQIKSWEFVLYVFCFVLKYNLLQYCGSVTFWYGAGSADPYL